MGIALHIILVFFLLPVFLDDLCCQRPVRVPDAAHPLPHLCEQVYDTPESHVTRDFKEGIGRLGDLRFRVVDTSGLEPDKPQRSIQVRCAVGRDDEGEQLLHEHFRLEPRTCPQRM